MKTRDEIFDELRNASNRKRYVYMVNIGNNQIAIGHCRERENIPKGEVIQLDDEMESS